jgi:ABC-type branched-subunit amino acid transport system substrate-binding protein
LLTIAFRRVIVNGNIPTQEEKMRKVLFIFFVALCVFVLTPFVFSTGSAELKVGTLMAQTGPLAEYGPAIQNGAVLAAKQLGEAGMEVTLIHEDSETNPIPAVTAARKLVNVDGVVAIIGALSSGVTLAVGESVTIPNDIIMISPASTNPLMTDLPADRGKDFLFRTCPSDALQGVVAGQLAAENLKTASIIYVNNAYGQGLASVFTTAFEANGGRVLASVPHDEVAAESYTAELRRALEGNPEALAAYSYPQHAEVYLKEALEFFEFGNFFFCDGTKSLDIIDAVGADKLEGLIGTAPGSVGGRALELFNDYYEAEFGELPPLPFITNAYDAMAVLGLAAYAAGAARGPVTATQIRDKLRLVSNPSGTVIYPGEFKKAFQILDRGGSINYEGSAGSVDFDSNGDVVTPIEVWQYTGGTMETIRLETP